MDYCNPIKTNELFLYVTLKDLLPLIGICYVHDDNYILQSIDDFRSFHILIHFLKNIETRKLVVYRAKSSYLTQAIDLILSNLKVEYVSNQMILEQLPSSYIYVSESYPENSVLALRLALTCSKTTKKQILFKGSIGTEYATITANNLAALNILPNQTSNKGVIDYIDLCVTPLGRRRLKRCFIHHPIYDRQSLITRQDEIYNNDPNVSNQLQSMIKLLPDLDRITLRLYGLANVSSERAIQHVAVIFQLWKTLFSLYKIIEQVDFKGCMYKKLKTKVMSLTSLINLLTQLFDMESLSKGSTVFIININSEVSPLAKFFNEAASLRTQINNYFKEIEKNFPKDKIKLIETEKDNYCIRAPKSVIVPQSYIKLKINKGYTLFTSNEIIDSVNKLNELREHTSNAELEVIKKTYALLTNFLQTFNEISDLLGLLDILLGADNAIKLLPNSDKLWTKPTISHDNFVHLIGARHPLLTIMYERGIIDKAFVNNDFKADENSRISIVTGANMGGKSTYSRTVASIIVLAQLGIRIPAYSGSCLPTCSTVWTRIGGSDNPCRGLSTFMTEAAETAGLYYAVFSSTDRVFCVIDELGRGTSVTDGHIFARSVVVALSQHPNLLCICATHFKNLFNQKNGIKLIHVGNLQDPKLRYRIYEGEAFETHALELAKQFGLPDDLINKANKMKQMVSLLNFNNACTPEN